MAKEKVHFCRLNPLSTKFFSDSQVKNIEGFFKDRQQSGIVSDW